MTEKTVEYIREKLSEIPLFQVFSDEELGQLLPFLELKSYSENTVLFEEGERGNYVCFVAEGTVEIRKQSISGHQSVIAKFGRGSTVGEMAVLGLFPRSAEARVTSNSRLLILTQDNFEKIARELPGLGLKFLREIARILSLRLRHTSGRFGDLF